MTKRPGVIIKASTIPETISELGKKEMPEGRISYTIRIRQSTLKKLREKSLEYGYTQQEIAEKALMAFLK